MAKIVYVCGWQRSGSTLLGILFAGVEGCAGIGEVHYLWNSDNPSGEMCGCLLPFDECPVWTQVFDALGIDDKRTRTQAHSRRAAEMRLRNVPRRFAEWVLLGRRPEHSGRLDDVYDAYAEATGADVIVDTTKIPADALASTLTQRHETYVLHLVRDPRATAFSRQRDKSHGSWGNARAMRKDSATRNALLWSGLNLMTDCFVRPTASQQAHFKRLRYEDLVADPAGIMRALLDWIGLEDRTVPVTPDGRFDQPRTHSLMGNPDRFKTGVVAIRADEEWRSARRPRQNALTVALTAPLFWAYRYRVR